MRKYRNIFSFTLKIVLYYNQKRPSTEFHYRKNVAMITRILIGILRDHGQQILGKRQQVEVELNIQLQHQQVNSTLKHGMEMKKLSIIYC